MSEMLQRIGNLRPKFFSIADLKSGFLQIQSPVRALVGHEIDSEGINMSQNRVESTIDVIRPTNLKELYSFIGLVDYFHGHIPHHATVAKSLTLMVSVANQSKTKSISWTDAGMDAFQI